MFVSELSITKKSSIIQKSAVPKGAITTVIAQKIIEIAPELVEEGFKTLSSTIAGFTEDYKNETVVRKNINGERGDNIFVPKHISIIRASFPLDIKENQCFDGYGKKLNSEELSDKKLQIELDIIKSKDRNSFYFQTTSYYYSGRDNQRKNIDEINLSFAFVTADENISDDSSILFRKIISFKDLEDEYEYSFKLDDNRYDTTYQSPWISSELTKKGSYTIIFKIEERRYRKYVAKTLNRIYKKHENELKQKINREIKEQLTKSRD